MARLLKDKTHGSQILDLTCEASLINEEVLFGHLTPLLV